jgi:hypothetical protein
MLMIWEGFHRENQEKVQSSYESASHPGIVHKQRQKPSARFRQRTALLNPCVFMPSCLCGFTDINPCDNTTLWLRNVKGQVMDGNAEPLEGADAATGTLRIRHNNVGGVDKAILVSQ